jgi:hypothetical protein
MLVNKIGHNEEQDIDSGLVSCDKKMVIQMGGFFLSDNREKNLYRRILNYNLKNQLQFNGMNLFSIVNDRRLNRPGGIIKEGENLFNETIKRINDDKYLKLYKFFFNEVFDKQRSTQKFSKKKGGRTILESSRIYPYVKNFMAIICISFLLELELYSLTHYVLTPNFFNKDFEDKIMVGNKVPSIFKPYSKNVINSIGSDTETNPFRVYRKFLSGYDSQQKRVTDLPSMTDIVEEFTKRMDIIFNKFMNLLIQNLAYSCNRAEEEIKNIIVVGEHYNHGHKRNPEGKDAYLFEDGKKENVRVDDFDHIYVHWKDRLIKFIDNNLSRSEINKIIGDTLNQFENNKAKYIAEGTGFFSFIFLKYVDPMMSKDPSLYKDKVHNGSCITYSAIEAYILSRLHVNGNHINLLLRSRKETKPNDYWIYCQKALSKAGNTGKVLNFSHWASLINFKSGGDIRLRASNNTYEDLLTVNFVKNRALFTKLLLYPIFDSYKAYLRQLKGVITIELESSNGTVQRDIKVDEYVNKIFNFIQARFNMVETILNKKDKSDLSFSMLTKRNIKKQPRKKTKLFRPRNVKDKKGNNNKVKKGIKKEKSSKSRIKNKA